MSTDSAPQRITVLSYNIHKGFATGNKRFCLNQIKQAVRGVQADLVCLQEVLGAHDGHAEVVVDWPTAPQFEFLADEVWPHFAYGKNAVYDAGHHGNAILSKYPIEAWSNFDISTNNFESRGFVHAQLKIPELTHRIHCICVHLGLTGAGRKKQLELIIKRIEEEVAPHEPLLLAGDFNDWSIRATKYLAQHLNVQEAFQSKHGKHPKTFPIQFPILALDRIYFRGLRLLEATILQGPPWNSLSDHAALCAEFEFGS